VRHGKVDAPQQTELNWLRPMTLSPKFFLNRFRAAMVAACLVALAVYLSNRPAAAPQTRFVLLDGSSTVTDDFKGRVTLVNFWATSCAVCVAEMPQLVATHQKFQSQGFATVAVAMQYDPPSYVVHFAQTRLLPFGVAIDNTGEVAQAWGDVAATPTTFLLNRRGEIVRRYVGAPDFAELHRIIERLLQEA
jgi:peroxiredoxin